MHRPRLWILALVGGLAVGALILIGRWGGGPEQLLVDYHERIAQWVADYPVWAALVYVTVFASVVLLALPGGTIMSLSGGYLFGVTGGVCLAISGATLGAMATLCVVHSALGAWLRERVSGRYALLRRVFLSNTVRYLLILRLIPVFPFFAVNIAAAVLGVRPGVFLWTTIVGLLPSTVVFAALGQGLGKTLSQDEVPGVEVLLEPWLLWPSLVLVALLLVAGHLRTWLKRDHSRFDHSGT